MHYNNTVWHQCQHVSHITKIHDSYHKTTKTKDMYSDIHQWYWSRTNWAMLTHLPVRKEVLHRQVHSPMRFVKRFNIRSRFAILLQIDCTWNINRHQYITQQHLLMDQYTINNHEAHSLECRSILFTTQRHIYNHSTGTNRVKTTIHIWA